jgi:hypothetical protein
MSFKTFFGLKEALEALFGRSVDLVEPRAIQIPISNRASSGRASPSLRRDPKSSCAPLWTTSSGTCSSEAPAQLTGSTPSAPTLASTPVWTSNQ